MSIQAYSTYFRIVFNHDNCYSNVNLLKLEYLSYLFIFFIYLIRLLPWKQSYFSEIHRYSFHFESRDSDRSNDSIKPNYM